MKIILSSALPLAALMVTAAAPAFGKDAESSFQVSASVPAYCDINASPLLAGKGDGLVTGSVFESCNTQGGFQIVASHRPLEANEWVMFDYAGNVRNLSASGWSEVASRAGAKYGMRPVGVRYTSLVAPLSINLTVTMF